MEIDHKKHGENCLGRVIRILSNKELIVDVGDNDLTVGDKVVIYATGDEIFDLDGKFLGVYEYDKATLEVITTTHTYSICATPKKTENVGAIVDYTKMFSKEVTTQDSFNVSNNDIEGIKINNSDRILKGDLVKMA